MGGALGTMAVQRQLGDHPCLIPAEEGKARDRNSDRVQPRAGAESLAEALASVCVCWGCVCVCQGLDSISSKNRKAWENIEGNMSWRYACKEWQARGRCGPI